MSWDRKLYPDNWEAIALAIKEEVNWTCEGCGKVCRRPGEALADLAQRANVPLSELQAHPKRWELGVAHLDHVPGHCDRANLKALCTPCHCRYDLGQMPRKQMLKREREGQLRIDDPWEEGVQLSLMPGAVAPFSLPRRGEAREEGRGVEL
ncbi:MAG: HNH endonuclease [Cyanobacteria bacterium J06639_14]